MYSSGNGRTSIKVGGNDRSKVEPLYSVPIQTTATLNIQFTGQKISSTSVNTNQSPQSNRFSSVQTSGPIHPAVTATRVNVLAEIPPKRPSSILSDDSMSSLGTQTDFSSGQPPSYDVSTNSANLHRSTTGSRDEMLQPSSAAFQTDDVANVTSDVNAIGLSNRNSGFSDAASQISFSETGSQVGFSDSASLWGASSALATPGSSSAASGSASLMPGSSSSVTAGTAFMLSAANSSNSGKDTDEDEGSEYRVFTDASGGGIGPGDEAAAKAKQLAQGTEKSLTGGGDRGGGAWDLRAGEDDDSDDEDSWEELGKPADPSTFNLIEWNIPEKASRQLACSRVIIMKDKEMIFMLKAACSSPKTGNNQKFLSLLVEIAENCSKRLKKMKTLPNLRAQHMDTLPLSDGRTTRDRLDEISSTLGDNIGIKEVAYRFQPEGGDVYIGTFVQGTILARRNYAIGKVGVVAVLFKKSKYATVEAFSEQLCEHIAIAQPTTLGHLSDGDLKKLNRRGTTRIQHLQKDQLLVQIFIFDPTIVVAEAARRSFVRIEDFLLFK